MMNHDRIKWRHWAVHLVAWCCSTAILSLIPIVCYGITLMLDGGPFGPMTLVFVPILSIMAAVTISSLSLVLNVLLAWVDTKRRLPPGLALVMLWLLDFFILLNWFSARHPVWIAGYGIAAFGMVMVYQIPKFITSKILMFVYK